MNNLNNLESLVLNSEKEYGRYYGEVLRFKAIGLSETKILTLRSIKREKKQFLDMRTWIKWVREENFHPGKGVCFDEAIMLRDVMPVLNEWYGTINSTIEGA